MTRHVALLVALSPALASLALCVVANWGALRSVYVANVVGPVRSALRSRAHVGTLISVSSGILVAGPVVTALYWSKNGQQPWDQPIAIAMSVVVAMVTILLSRRLAELDRAHETEQRAQHAAVLRALEAQQEVSTRPPVA